MKAPNLDDRSFEEIKEMVRARIPRYTQEWTDFNESDPGITLIELFSWLTEMMLFRMNQVPDRNYIKFLKLLNLELDPPTPALADLTFNPRQGAKPVPVPRRTRVAAQSQETGELINFETEAGLDLIPYLLSDIQVYDGAAFQSRTEENTTTQSSYYPFGTKPKEGSALYLGFMPPDPLPPPGTRYFPQQMSFRVFFPAETTAGTPQVCDLSGAGLPPAPPVELVWEYRHPEPPYRWLPLTLFKDETAAFTREGYIEISGPDKLAKTNEGRLIDPSEEQRFWLRCRVARGIYPLGKEPEIEFIRANTVAARSVTTVRDEILGRSDGTPNQYFELRRSPILQVTGGTEEADNLQITVESSDGTLEPWQRVDDFLSSGADDNHYTLKSAAGTIQFGDGRNGRIPAGNAEIVAAHYRYGGGKAANVAAGSITIPLTTLTGVDSITNEREAVGGRDEQTVEELKAKAPCVLRHRNRAVTAEDFASLALRAGGVIKATALAQTHPDYPGVSVPGAVTLVIVPDSDDSPPQPSAELIRYLCGYLDEYRLLTTELYVKGPEFVEVRVDVQVSALPQVAAGTVQHMVRAALDTRLDPREWVFGRDFNPTGLYRDIYRIKDNFGNEVVKEIPHLAISVKKPGQGLQRIEGEQLSNPVVINPDQLIYAGEHNIIVVPDTDQ
jgi:predicted phage baseplate assembly protein